jgi:hypothetical protein
MRKQDIAYEEIGTSIGLALFIEGQYAAKEMEPSFHFSKSLP